MLMKSFIRRVLNTEFKSFIIPFYPEFIHVFHILFHIGVIQYLLHIQEALVGILPDLHIEVPLLICHPAVFKWTGMWAISGYHFKFVPGNNPIGAIIITFYHFCNFLGASASHLKSVKAIARLFCITLFNSITKRNKMADVAGDLPKKVNGFFFYGCPENTSMRA